MAENKTKNKKGRAELIILIFVIVTMVIVVFELFSNIFAHLFG